MVKLLVQASSRASFKIAIEISVLAHLLDFISSALEQTKKTIISSLFEVLMIEMIVIKNELIFQLSPCTLS